MENEPKVRKVHLVCSGNLERSVIAGVIFRYRAEEMNLPVIVTTSGLEAEIGMSVPERVNLALINLGYPFIDGHHPAQFNPEAVQDADYIFCFTKREFEKIGEKIKEANLPDLLARVYIFPEYADLKGKEIPDISTFLKDTFYTRFVSGFIPWYPVKRLFYALGGGSVCPCDGPAAQEVYNKTAGKIQFCVQRAAKKIIEEKSPSPDITQKEC